MNIVLDASLTAGTREGGFPLALPTCRITALALKHVCRHTGNHNRTPHVLISLQAYREVIANAERESISLDGIEFQFSECMGRHDFVNGDWCARTPGTPEYHYANYEDAVIFEEGQPTARAVLRFRRATWLNPDEWMC